MITMIVNQTHLINKLLKHSAKILGLVLILSLLITPLKPAQTITDNEEVVYFLDLDLVNNLASFMEDGYIDGFLVLSTAVINDREGYYILVKLSSGETRRVFFNHILSLTMQNRLQLAKNHALLINNDNTIEFFDKGKFNRNAFNARIYVSQAGFGAPYEDKMVPYLIKDLALLDKNQNITNEKGEKYMYLLSLQNNEKIFLTLKDAYESYKRNAFLTNSLNYNPLGSTNPIVYFFSRTKERLGSLGSQIIIEIRFKNKIQFTPDMVAFEIKKPPLQNLYAKDDFYFFDLYLPNSNIDKNIKQMVLPKLGVFDRMVLTVDNQNKSSAILRAYLKQADYQFISELPKIEFKDEFTLNITYIQITDQTNQNFEYAKSRTDKGTTDLFEISNKLNNTPFYRQFSDAMMFINEANSAIDITKRIDGMISGIDRLDMAGASAVDDIQLINLVEAKQKVRRQIYKIIIEHVQTGLAAANFDRSQALNLIDKVESLIIDDQEIITLNSLKGQLVY